MTAPTYPKLAKALAVTAALLPLSLVPARGGDLAAVISSDSGAYAEAFAAFRASMQAPFDTYDLSKSGADIPEEVRFVVAFGAKAAALQYAPGTHLVYALTPVTGRGRLWHEISMVPEPGAALAAYKALQPGLKRLAVLWAAYPGEKYLSELKAAGAGAGVEIISSRIKGPDMLPDRLRGLMGKIDAFWLMPDPALITQSSIMLLSSFSCENGIPFYAPTAALVASGATASFAPDFSRSGAEAAKAVMIMYRNGELPAVSYVPEATLKVNKEASLRCRWPLAK